MFLQEVAVWKVFHLVMKLSTYYVYTLYATFWEDRDEEDKILVSKKLPF